MNSNLFRFMLGIGVALVICAPAIAQEKKEAEGAEKTSALAADEIANYLGEWALTLQSQRGEAKGHLSIRQDRQGVANATVKTRENQEPRKVDSIKKTDSGLEMRYVSSVQGNDLKMIITAKREGEGLTGEIADEGGRFSMQFAGKKQVGAVGRAGGETAEGSEGEESADAEGGGSGRRAMGGRAKVTLNGKEINFNHGMVTTKGEEDEALEALKDGEVLALKSSTPIKLRTPIDLKFGDATIKTGNQGADYPGVYSLWLKKAGSGWHLVFNNEADVWGTMYNPAANAAEIPLDHATLSTPEAALKTEVTEAAGVGLLRIAFGAHEWKTAFKPAN